MLQFAVTQWKYVLIAVLILLLGTVSKLYFNESAKYEAFVAQVAATAAIQKAEQAKDKETSDAFIATKEKEHVEELANIHSAWRAELDGLRKHSGRIGAAKSVPVTARICENASANERLSNAVQIFERQTEDAINVYQDGVGRLLENADSDAAALRKINEWAAGEQLINQ